jgi:SAM-dependent methyltransferase
MRLLDVGCGPGSITADLAERVADVVGIDRSEGVLDEARDTAPDNVTYAVGDVYAIEAPSASFDVVHAHQVLQHLTDPVAALREMARVCRPGGLVAVRDADYAAMAWAPRLPELDRWNDLYHRVAWSNDAEPDAARHLKGWVLGAGLDVVSVTASTWVWSAPDEVGWWAQMWAERVVASALADQAVSQGEATAADLRGIADGFRAWGADPAACWIIPHAEILATPR